MAAILAAGLRGRTALRLPLPRGRAIELLRPRVAVGVQRERHPRGSARLPGPAKAGHYVLCAADARRLRHYLERQQRTDRRANTRRCTRSRAAKLGPTRAIGPAIGELMRRTN